MLGSTLGNLLGLWVYGLSSWGKIDCDCDLNTQMLTYTYKYTRNPSHILTHPIPLSRGIVGLWIIIVGYAITLSHALTHTS